MRNGGWMALASGRQFWPLDPRADEIHIEDIAHALSHICRYGGHSRRFYSVAEHSVLVSQLVPSEHALTGLLHDAAEAYLGDVPRPLKRQACMEGWREAEARLENAIAEAFGITLPMPDVVKEIDDRIILDEWSALMPRFDADIGVSGAPVGVPIIGMEPEKARGMFLARFDRLTGRRT